MAERFGPRALTPWEPFRALARLEEETNRLFGSGLRRYDWPLYYWRRPFVAEREYLAPMDIFERDGHTVVRLEVPGVKMEDIDISVTDGVLTIKGEKKQEKEIKEQDYHCSESWYGGFHRTVSLPEGLDASKISASSQDGVLEVLLPKAEEMAPHKIKVEAK